MSLEKQVWISQVMEKYYPETSFLKYATDMSNLVDNDKINLADAGMDPAVLKNNTNYPISVHERTDNALELELNLYETENTLVQDAVITELSYNKLESVLVGHRGSLQKRTGADAAHAFSPDSNEANTPILMTTGEVRANGFKKLLPDDILSLMEEWNGLNYPLENRYLVLDARMLADLMRFDLRQYGNITDIVNGQPKKFGSFHILAYSQNAVYNVNTLQKKSFGAAEQETDTYSSFAFLGNEVMKADGSLEMFERLKDPEYRGDIVGFAKRFLAMPIRNKGISAIVANKV
jgi:hypothetical protein